jgi:hypothetical protein
VNVADPENKDTGSDRGTIILVAHLIAIVAVIIYIINR